MEADPRPEISDSTIVEPIETRSLDGNTSIDSLKRAKALERKTNESRIPRQPRAAQAQTAAEQAVAEQAQKTSPAVAEQAQKTSPVVAEQAQKIGDRVKHLRLRTQELLEQGNAESAQPLLYEMIALQPDNTYALSRLVQYHRERSNLEFAKFFADRLKSHSPF